jgi:hypothetical protein
VDLVGEHPRAVPVRDRGHAGQLRRGKRAAQRVVRVGQDERARAGRERRADRVEVERRPAGGIRDGGHGDDRPPGQRDAVQERRVGRRGDDDRCVLAEHLDREADPGHHVAGLDHVRRVDAPAQAVGGEAGQRLGEAGARQCRVAEVAAVDGVVQRGRDRRAGPDVHLGHPGRQDVVPVPPLDRAGGAELAVREVEVGELGHRPKVPRET